MRQKAAMEQLYVAVPRCGPKKLPEVLVSARHMLIVSGASDAHSVVKKKGVYHNIIITSS